MPNRPINFEFLADVSQYLREVKGASISTEDLADALVGVTESGDDMERKLAASMRDAARDTETLERALKDVGDAADRMGDEAKRGFEKVGDEAKDAGREVGSEFRSSLGEGLASGGSLSDVLSETLGEVTGGLGGPLGVAAGILAGGALLAFNKVREEAEKIKAVMESLGDSLRSQFEQGVFNATAIQQLEAFNQWLSDNVDTTGEWKDELAAAGITFDEFVTAMFQGGEPLDAMIAKLEQIKAENTVITEEGRKRRQIMNEEADAADELLGILTDTEATHNTTAGHMRDQAESSQRLAQQLGLVDLNADGIINDLDLVGQNLETANRRAETFEQTLARLGRSHLKIPVTFSLPDGDTVFQKKFPGAVRGPL